MNLSLAEIQNLALFSEIPSSDLKNILKDIKKLQIAEGKVLFNEGDNANGLYFIMKGDIKARRITSEGKEIVLFISREGYLIGEGAVFQNNTQAYTAIASTDAQILFLANGLCHKLVEKYPSFSCALLRFFSLRQRMFVHKLAAQGEKNALIRISAYILHRCFLEGANSTSFSLHIGREELANLLGFARETVSRQLSLLVEYDAIKLEGRTIHIINEELLKSISEGN